MPKTVVIHDIDNSIADDSWRIQFIDWAAPVESRYTLYHRLSVSDNPDLSVLFHRPPGHHFVVFITSRDECFRPITKAWLEMHKIHYDLLLMRPNGNHQPSIELKQAALAMLMGGEFEPIGQDTEIVFATDDRKDICDMYHRAGVKLVIQHAIHQIPHDPPPKKTAPDLLDSAAATFRERNAIYGNNYQRLGAALLAIFPDGGIPAITTPEDANRLNLFIDCFGKLQRYAHNWHRGGHQDSVHDLQVYAAMLEEFTK